MAEKNGVKKKYNKMRRKKGERGKKKKETRTFFKIYKTMYIIMYCSFQPKLSLFAQPIFVLVYLLTVLLEHPELEALVQLVPLQLPQLQQLLLTAVDLVQQLHYLNKNSF